MEVVAEQSLSCLKSGLIRWRMLIWMAMDRTQDGVSSRSDGSTQRSVPLESKIAICRSHQRWPKTRTGGGLSASRKTHLACIGLSCPERST